MNKITHFLCFLLLLSLPAFAQLDTTMSPPDEMGEIHAGYSYTTTDIGMHGWQLSGAFRLTERFAAVADISGHYGSEETLLLDVNTNVHNFLFGPRYYFDLQDYDRLRPFAHVLFGASRIHSESPGTGAEFTDTAFAWAVGGGLDYSFNENLAARIPQLDYLRTNFGANGGQNNLRLGIGLIYRFGR